MMLLVNAGTGYQGKQVLKNVSLHIATGDFIALVGPNGSGKSTLLKVLAGQNQPEGRVLLHGRPLEGYPAKKRAEQLAYFPQSRPVPNMDVYTLVSHGRFPHLGFGRVAAERDHQIVRQALAQTGLLEMADRPVESLSGGERQRAYLAMAIAQNAGLILLDEPSTFLDIQYQIEILDIMAELNRQGKTIVFAAHDLPSAFSYAKRVILLENGQVACDAPPELAADSPCFQQVFGVAIQKQTQEALFRYVLKK